MEEDSLILESLAEITDHQSHESCEWRRKYARAQGEVRKLRNEIESEKALNNRMKEILVREIGTLESVEEALNSKGTGSNGRAEEIADLKKRLKQVSSLPIPAPSMAVVVHDKKKTLELEATVERLRAETSEADTLKRALKARIHSLEEMLASAKCDIKIMLDKDRVNSELVLEMAKRLNST
jgi:hypothetical protein